MSADIAALTKAIADAGRSVRRIDLSLDGGISIYLAPEPRVPRAAQLAQRKRPEFPTGHKQCRICREVKPAEEFYFKVHGYLGRESRCKICRRAAKNERQRVIRERGWTVFQRRQEVKRRRADLDDDYVADRLRKGTALARDAIPHDLIEAERIRLKIKQEIRR